MKFYNTLTRSVEPFTPHCANIVKMYTCGPTVYHFAHIGNLRTYIMEDILQKALEYEGYTVDRAMNITDVGHLSSDGDTGEDKMLRGAKREHKSVMEIAAFYREAFFRDLTALHIEIPKKIVPATACIDDFIRVITTLLNKGYAYEAGGNIYFDTSRCQEYNVLTAHQSEQLIVGARTDVSKDTNKRNQADFVLWFTKSKFEDQELKWDSPFGVGYPGWHIECSCISMQQLGEYLDIHCGGVDNIFPHHTNEIAQSEAYLGHPWCHYWFHVHHLNDERGKMSKSSGEFLTLSLLQEKGYDPLVYRLFCLQSHYRKPLTFSFEALDNAKATYERLLAKVSRLSTNGTADATVVAHWHAAFCETIGNDLNTAMALTMLYDVLKADCSDATKRAVLADFDRVLSLNLCTTQTDRPATSNDSIDAEDTRIQALIAQRAQAKKDHDFATADAIRATLAAEGIALIDTKEGTTYRRL